MAMIAFEDRAVAVIDVLGFKSLVTDTANGDPKSHRRLQAVVDLLESAVPRFDAAVGNRVPAHLIPRHLAISDTIILSAPLRCQEQQWYSGLDAVIMRCIQLTHVFLDEGILLRGGIEAGKAWHAPKNIVGPAYQDAYRLETEACMPRVVLGKTAESHFNQGLSTGSRMCIRRDGSLMVNGLHDYYIEGKSQLGGVEARYDKYSDIISNVLSSETGACEKAKWHWLNAYLEDERKAGA